MYCVELGDSLEYIHYRDSKNKILSRDDSYYRSIAIEPRVSIEHAHCIHSCNHVGTFLASTVKTLEWSSSL